MQLRLDPRTNSERSQAVNALQQAVGDETVDGSAHGRARDAVATHQISFGRDCVAGYGEFDDAFSQLCVLGLHTHDERSRGVHGDLLPVPRWNGLVWTSYVKCCTVLTGVSSQRHDATPPEKGRTMSTKADKILAGLGGAGNIDEIEACITRLRTVVVDPTRVDTAALKAAGAHGVLTSGTVVQVVVGPEADVLAEDIEDLL